MITFEYMHLYVLFQEIQSDYPQLDHWHHLVLKHIISHYADINQIEINIENGLVKESHFRPIVIGLY